MQDLGNFFSNALGKGVDYVLDKNNRVKERVEFNIRDGVALPKSRKEEAANLANQGPLMSLKTEYFTYGSRYTRTGKNALLYNLNPTYTHVENSIFKCEVPSMILENVDLRDGFDQGIVLKASNLTYYLCHDVKYLPRAIPILSLWDIIDRLYIKKNLYDRYSDQGVGRWTGLDISEAEKICQLSLTELLLDIALHPIRHLDMILQLYLYQDCSSVRRTDNYYIICEDLAQRVIKLQINTPTEQLTQWCICTSKTHSKGFNINTGTADVYKNFVKRVSSKLMSCDIGNSCKCDNIEISTAYYAAAKITSTREKNSETEYDDVYNK